MDPPKKSAEEKKKDFLLWYERERECQVFFVGAYPSNVHV
jgi:hypothetical protein